MSAGAAALFRTARCPGGECGGSGSASLVGPTIQGIGVSGEALSYHSIWERDKTTFVDGHCLSVKCNLAVAVVHLEPRRIRIDPVKALFRLPDLPALVNQRDRIVRQWDIVRLQDGGPIQELHLSIRKIA